MSKAISIQEGGVGKLLTVDALRLPKLNGGTLDVVPADEKNLVKITVKQNGTYKASDFGAYGIAEVRVACTLNGGSATSEGVTKDITEGFNPAPSEGGIARIFTATRIATLLSGGGECQWLLKDSVELGTKSINVDNTTYRAEDDGYYGYSQVTVSGISITKTTDDDGNEVVEHTDGTGTETMIVPSSIVIETLPTFTGPYYDGQTITDAGMVVKAYKGDGTLWTSEKYSDGIIPLSELTLNPQTADKDSASGSYGQIVWEGLVQPAYLIKVEIGDLAEDSFTAPIVSITGGDLYYAIYGSGVYQRAYLATAPGVEYSKGDANKDRYRNLPKQEFTYNGETFYYSSSTGGYGPALPKNLFYRDLISAPQELGNPSFYGALLYGAAHGGGAIGKKEVITVSWHRPYDNEILSATFEITL